VKERELWMMKEEIVEMTEVKREESEVE